MGKKQRKKAPKKSSQTAFLTISIVVLLTYLVSQIFTSPTENFTELSIPSPFHMGGIDVSHHQGTVDWKNLDSSVHNKVQFVYFKATEGKDLVDKSIDQHINDLQQGRFKKGAYHFLSARSSAKAQATNFIRIYSKYAWSLPPVLDVELQHVPKNKLISLVSSWIDLVETELNQKVLIYAPLKLYQDVLQDAFPNHRFWIAAYSITPVEIKSPQVLMWQYSDQGKLPGIDGHVDLNYAKKELLNF